jgi:hypothetical protein
VTAARSGALLAAAVLLLAPVACTGADGDDVGPTDKSAAAVETLTVRPGLYLARPAPEDPERNITLRRLIAMVEATPPGERIRVVAHSFSFRPAAEALVAAHGRGVHVQVISDASVSGDWKAPALLRDALGTDRGEGSFLYLAPGEVHEKTWSFTRTGASRDVVMVGSENLTYESAGQYTDVWAYVGRRDVRRVFDRRFSQLLTQLPRLAPVPPVRLGRDRLWFYPLPAGAPDPVLEQLRAVPPAGAVVRVAMYAWLDERGLELARQLVAMRAAGADVLVVAGRSVAAPQLAVLRDGGVPVHSGVYAREDDIHHKLTLVSYLGDDGRRHRFVLTGSDNYTEPSLHRPELLLRIDADRGATFDRYERWVEGLVRRSRRES